ncbi:MAG: hypothetical protein AMXMBFR84_46500 [Candidatus Hydrogenedentota bacterium]
MRLYLFRHGIAIDRDDPSCPSDPDRWITDKGKVRIREVALGLAAMGVHPAQLLSSPYTRARQTAEIVSEAMGLSKVKIQLTQSLLPEAPPSALVEFLHDRGDVDVMCFGHAPNLDEIIGLCLGTGGAITSLKKAGVACIAWARPVAGTGQLEWLYTPKTFRLPGKDRQET